MNPSISRASSTRQSARQAGISPARHAVHGSKRCARSRHRRPSIPTRSEEHTSELQSLMRISYAVFCLKKKKQKNTKNKQETGTKIHKRKTISTKSSDT